jgi:hypothetical protein
MAGLPLGYEARLHLEALGIRDPAEAPHHEGSPLVSGHGWRGSMRGEHSPAP